MEGSRCESPDLLSEWDTGNNLGAMYDSSDDEAVEATPPIENDIGAEDQLDVPKEVPPAVAFHYEFELSQSQMSQNINDERADITPLKKKAKPSPEAKAPCAKQVCQKDVSFSERATGNKKRVLRVLVSDKENCANVANADVSASTGRFTTTVLHSTHKNAPKETRLKSQCEKGSDDIPKHANAENTAYTEAASVLHSQAFSEGLYIQESTALQPRNEILVNSTENEFKDAPNNLQGQRILATDMSNIKGGPTQNTMSNFSYDEPASKSHILPKCEQNLGTAKSEVEQDLFSTGKPKPNSKQRLENAKLKLEEEPTSLFSTGKGKAIPISKQHLEAAKSKLEEESTSPVSTVNGNTTPITEHRLEAATSKLENEPTSLFSTGKGKTIPISKQRLEAAKSKLEEEPTSLLSTGKGRTIPISKQRLETGKSKLDVKPTSLFSTGKGKTIPISKQRLEAAKSKLGDKPTSLFSTRKGETIPISKKRLEATRMNLEAETTSLFSTGNGETMPTSKKLLEAAKPNLKDEATSLLSTGNGETTPISKKRLEAAKSNLEDEPTSLFSTGKGKTIPISKQRLEAAKSKLEDEPTSLPSSERGQVTRIAKPTLENTKSKLGDGPTSLFSTGHGKAVSISKRSLENAKSKLENEVASLFSTGRGKAVPISKESLDNAKSKMGDDSVSLFSTGSGNAVPISAQSLERAQSKLEQDPRKMNVTVPKARSDLKTVNPEPVAKPVVPRSKRNKGAFVVPLKTSAVRNCTRKHPKPTAEVVEKTNNTCRISLDSLVDGDFELGRMKKEVSKEALRRGVPTWIVFSLSSENSADVVFDSRTGLPSGFSSEASSSSLGWKAARDKMIMDSQINAKLATDEWVANHYRWIIWKLGSMRRMFPHVPLLRKAFCFGNVMRQLVYRYNRIFTLTERPVIQKILEKDSSSTVHMVLCVVKVCEDGNVVVTDGWYAMDTFLDPSMKQLVKSGLLAVGDKFRVCGAQMNGNESGISPLECACNKIASQDSRTILQTQPRLRLSRNCTAPVPWNCKLGRQHDPYFTKRLSRVVSSQGTVVPCINAIVFRIFEAQFCEKDESTGRWVYRTEREEQDEQAKHEAKVESAKEAIVSQFAGWEDSSQSSQSSSCSLGAIQSKIESRRQEVTEAFSSDVRMPKPRHVKKMIRFVLKGLESETFAEISVWNPSEVHMSLQEGFQVQVHSPTVSSASVLYKKHNILGLFSTSLTRFHVVSENLTPRNVQMIHAIPSCTFPIVDTVGVVVYQSESRVFLVCAGGHSVLMLRLAVKLTTGSTICLRDILFENVDPTTGYINATATYSGTILKTRKSLDTKHYRYFIKAYDDLNKWATSEEGKSIISKLGQQLESLVYNPTHYTPPAKSERERRLRTQQLKQKQWRERHKHAKEPFVIYVKSDILTHIMLGKKTIFLLARVARLDQPTGPQPKDTIKFVSGKLFQHAVVQATIPYSSVYHALQHTSVSSILPDEPQLDTALQQLHKSLKPDQPISAILFTAI